LELVQYIQNQNNSWSACLGFQLGQISDRLVISQNKLVISKLSDPSKRNTAEGKSKHYLKKGLHPTDIIPIIDYVWY
jgi:hypothetical protein